MAYFNPGFHKLSFDIPASRNCSSRASEEDTTVTCFDDPEVIFNSACDTNTDIRPHTLIIGVGAAGSAFLNCLVEKNHFFAEYQLSGGTSIQTYDTKSVGSTQRNTTKPIPNPDTKTDLYLYGDVILSVNHSGDKIPEECSLFWASSLLRQPVMADIKDVIVLTSLNESFYRGSGQPGELRLLRNEVCSTTKTTDASHHDCSNFQILEPPNIITGISAAILSICQMYDINSTVYTVLEPLGSQCFLELDSVRAFQNILPHLNYQMTRSQYCDEKEKVEEKKIFLTPTINDYRRSIKQQVVVESSRRKLGQLYS